MKIRKISIQNNKILGDLELNFINKNGNTFDTIIFVGENGSGKSTLLKLIYEFSELKIISNGENNEKRIFEIEFSKEEMLIINKYHFGISTNIYLFEFDLSINNGNLKQIRVTDILLNSEINIGIFINQQDIKALFKSIFSDVSINFTPKEIKSGTGINTDTFVNSSKKSDENIATDIKQMLVDIRISDNEDDIAWREINGVDTPEFLRQKRIKRFKNAFDILFKDKGLSYLGTKGLSPTFIKDGEDIKIDELSSGEKQIVFRGGYLLKDKESIKGAIALIDEPEISLHPIRQKKILEFYTYLFKDENGKQTSQIFITTHSPYVLQGYDLDDGGLFVFPWGERIDNLRKYIGDKPSLGVVNFEAYKLPTVEFHDELYGYIQDKTGNYKISEIENYFYWKLPKRKKWQEERDGILKGRPYLTTLQTFIRHKLHHPENKSMKTYLYNDNDLKKSIEEMIKIVKDNNL